MKTTINAHVNTTINAYINGTYRGNVEVFVSQEKIEEVINSLKNGQNTVVSFNNTRVYNSYMTPLYCAGEIKIAQKENGKIDRRFRYA